MVLPGLLLEVLRALRRRTSADAHPVDAPPLGVQDLDGQALDLECLADCRHAADVMHQEAAHGLETLPLNLDVEPPRNLVDAHLAAEDVLPATLVDDRLGLDVVLVPDFPDDLLEQILDGDQAGGSAVFVDDDRALCLLTLELLQQL